MSYSKNYSLIAASIFFALNTFPLTAKAGGLPTAAAEAVLGTDPMTLDTDGDGIPDLTDPFPVFADNPIPKTGKPNGFTFTAITEDNVDPVTKASASDHIEVEITNTSGETLKDLVLYYTLVDVITKKKEGYLKPLAGLSIPKDAVITLHLDQQTGPNHFRENPNSAYHTSPNAKEFMMQIAAAGYAPVQVDFKKDKGGAEKPD